MRTHVAWIQAADTRDPLVLESKSAKLGWVYTLFFLLPFFETGKAAVLSLRMGSNPCATPKALLQAAV